MTRVRLPNRHAPYEQSSRSVGLVVTLKLGLAPCRLCTLPCTPKHMFQVQRYTHMLTCYCQRQRALPAKNSSRSVGMAVTLKLALAPCRSCTLQMPCTPKHAAELSTCHSSSDHSSFFLPAKNNSRSAGMALTSKVGLAPCNPCAAAATPAWLSQ